MTHQSQNPDRIEEIIRKHFHGFSNEQFTEIKKSFPYSEIPYILSEYASLITKEKDALLLEKDKEIRRLIATVEDRERIANFETRRNVDLIEDRDNMDRIYESQLQSKEQRINDLEEDIDRFVWCLEQYYYGEINNYGIQKAEELISKYKNEEGE